MEIGVLGIREPIRMMVHVSLLLEPWKIPIRHISNLSFLRTKAPAIDNVPYLLQHSPWRDAFIALGENISRFLVVFVPQITVPDVGISRCALVLNPLDSRP